MIWTFLLAHFAGDYSLQSGKLAEAKQQWQGLLLHIGIHLLVMFGLTWGIWREVTRFILLIAGIHLLIDTIKSLVAKLRPDWVVIPYFFDQVFHLLTIFVVVGQMDPGLTPLLYGPWIKFALAVVLVTQVWFITERILFYRDQQYVKEVNRLVFKRAFVRTILMMTSYSFLSIVKSGPLQAIAGGLNLYSSKKYRKREILLDITVAVLTTIILFLPI